MEKWSLLSLICYCRNVSNFFSSSKELTSSPSECPPWCRCKCQALPFPKGNPSSVTAANLWLDCRALMLSGLPQIHVTGPRWELSLFIYRKYPARAFLPPPLFPSFLLSPLKVSAAVFVTEVMQISRMSPQTSGKTLMYISLVQA